MNTEYMLTFFDDYFFVCLLFFIICVIAYRLSSRIIVPMFFKISNQKRKTLEYWKDLDKWNINEASRLIICGPKQSFKCLNNCINNIDHCKFTHEVKNIEDLYKYSGMDNVIEPEKFISWAKTKITIHIPENILELYPDTIDIKINEIDDIDLIRVIIEEHNNKDKDGQIRRSLLALILRDGAEINPVTIYRALAKDPKATDDSARRTVNDWCQQAKKLLEERKDNEKSS